DSGDYIIVHAGMGISKISEEEVERTLKIWEEYLKELEAT
ncbi:MAG TPA: HypC/HybG/HupF family hydrogenase formation chaperone, partial [Thermoprotei archaeon]|nr:HypC/HybG/HupF family hydrogenase formation chaperone [Thermoprotei archaeon]